MRDLRSALQRLLVIGLMALPLMLGACGMLGEDATSEDGEVEANKLDEAQPAGEEGEGGDPPVIAGEPAAGDKLLISFEPGSGSTQVAGELASGGGVLNYVVPAAAGQTLLARVSGVSNGAVTLRLVDPEGAELGSSADNDDSEPRNQLSVELPSSGDFYLSVGSSASAPRLTYDLDISVTGEPAADEETEAGGEDASAEGDEAPGDTAGDDSADEAAGDDAAGDDTSGDEAADDGEAGTGDAAGDGDGIDGPTRISFEPGAVSGAIEGSLAPGEVAEYVLRAQEGQLLSVEVAPVGNIDVMVFNAAQRPLRAAGNRAGAPYYLLAATEDYGITLSNSGQAALDYSGTVKVMDDEGAVMGDGDAADAGDASDAPVTIFFAAGDTGTTVQGSIGGGQARKYKVRANAGQTMRLSLDGNQAGVLQLFVADMAGNIIASGLETNPMSIELTATTDYIITVQLPPGYGASDYALGIEVE